MPELPEVEVVRRGLTEQVVGREFGDVDIRHARAVRRGDVDLRHALSGRRILCVSRRGKYLWMPLGDAGGPARRALVAHLGMSGQFRVHEARSEPAAHVRVQCTFRDGGPVLSFVDQRTFGGLYVDELVDDGAGGQLPRTLAHIARDLFDPLFDEDAAVRRLKTRETEIKRALLDQRIVSGIGNIYADEALWRAGLHGRRPCTKVAVNTLRLVLTEARAVMSGALAAGGTSFDALYVNVNGRSGYFERSLAAYGRADQPCHRCAGPIRREAFMNRSSYFCPACQTPPRARRPPSGAG